MPAHRLNRECEFVVDDDWAAPSCGRPHLANGYCAAHNAQIRKGHPLTPIGVLQPLNTKRGEANGGGGKLTSDQAREIYASGAMQKSLAAEYGVHPSCVWRIKHGYLWRHVTGHPKPEAS